MSNPTRTSNQSQGSRGSRYRYVRSPIMTLKSGLIIIVDDGFRVREAPFEMLASRNLDSVAFQSGAEYLTLRKSRCS
jgi:hypothetical protein